MIGFENDFFKIFIIIYYIIFLFIFFQVEGTLKKFHDVVLLYIVNRVLLRKRLILYLLESIYKSMDKLPTIVNNL